MQPKEPDASRTIAPLKEGRRAGTATAAGAAPSQPGPVPAVGTPAHKSSIATRMEALKIKEAALQAKIDEAAKRESNSELLEEEAQAVVLKAQVRCCLQR